MFEEKCRIKELTRTLKGDCVLSLSVPKSFLKSYDGLVNKDLRLRLCEWHNKRSLDANAYFWVLCDKLAEATNIPKVEIYRSYVKGIGGNNDTVCVPDKAVNRLVKGWENNGIGWLTDTFASKIEGCTNVILYYGSSMYDSKQMASLINFVVQDCKSLDIETATPEELARLTEEWGNNAEQNI